MHRFRLILSAFAAMLFSFLSAPSFAAVDAAITTAITGAGTDILTALGSIMGAMIAAWGLKKLASKMGWL